MGDEQLYYADYQLGVTSEIGGTLDPRVRSAEMVIHWD